MKFFVTLFLCLCFSILTAFSQQPIKQSKEAQEIDQLIKQLKGLRFNYDIRDAKDSLSNFQQLALPKLIALLYNTTRLNTDPGDPYTILATGHYKGPNKVSIIPYNFDWLSIRAGYVIESLTFINFGYSSSYKISENGYGSFKITWNKIATAESLKKDRKILANKVAAWWQKNSTSWSRFNGLKTALNSKDKETVAWAVDFIFGGETKCDGFTKESYEKELKPLLENLLNNADEYLKRRIDHIFEYGPSDYFVPRG
jgi:hypothetical protein